MLIIGAKGFAKEILEILHRNGNTENLCFYDDINDDNPDFLFDKFKILKSIDEAKSHFENQSPEFIIGLGNPKHRKTVFEKFISIGGTPKTLISDHAEIGSFDNTLEEGVIITSGTIITNSIIIKKGALINLGCTIGHDSIIGEFAEICPNVSISGHCNIGNGVFVGTGATVLPGISVGENSIIAAGAVVTKDIPDNTLVAGAPAEVKRTFHV